MTKEITKAFILAQMEDKFGLRELIPERFSFSETVVPVYQVEQHVEHYLSGMSEVSITATGGYVFFTVPHDEKWILSRFNPVFIGISTIKITGIYIKREETPTFIVYLDMVKGQDVSYAYNLPQPVVLVPKDEIKITVDTYVSTQNLRLYIDYMMEKIR